MYVQPCAKKDSRFKNESVHLALKNDFMINNIPGLVSLNHLCRYPFPAYPTKHLSGAAFSPVPQSFPFYQLKNKREWSGLIPSHI